MPYSCTRSRKGVNYFSIGLWTPCLPFLTELYGLFYVNGIKCIPDSIYDLLTPIVLAHWIQGDGATTKKYYFVKYIYLWNIGKNGGSGNK